MPKAKKIEIEYIDEIEVKTESYDEIVKGGSNEESNDTNKCEDCTKCEENHQAIKEAKKEAEEKPKPKPKRPSRSKAAIAERAAAKAAKEAEAKAKEEAEAKAKEEAVKEEAPEVKAKPKRASKKAKKEEVVEPEEKQPEEEPEEVKPEEIKEEVKEINQKPKRASKKPKSKNSEQAKPDNEPAGDTEKEETELSLVSQQTPPTKPDKNKIPPSSTYPSKIASIRKLQERRQEQYNNLISKMF